MNRQYSIAQARSQFSQIIHEVEKGATVEVTRRGKPVAVLVPTPKPAVHEKKRKDFGEVISEYRKQLEKDGEFVTDDEIRSWRDRSPGRVVNFE